MNGRNDPAVPAGNPFPAGNPSGPPGLQSRYQVVLERIAAACRRAGRDPSTVSLLAVSKTFDAAHVLALASLGQRAFGENYLQEALAKMQACVGHPGETELQWHFIGPIQSNKTRPIAEHFDWVHSIDREKIASRLGEQRPEAMPPLQCCVQVNLSGEASKSGCPPEQVLGIARAVLAQPRLRLRGLMVIPEPTEDNALLRRRFADARRLLDSIRGELSNAVFPGHPALDTLSMGMSADLETAIEEGATIVRTGSALFGARANLRPST